MKKKTRRQPRTDGPQSPPASALNLTKLVPRWRKQVLQVGGGLAMAEQAHSLSAAEMLAWSGILDTVAKEIRATIHIKRGSDDHNTTKTNAGKTARVRR
jgi:hypothetical protein